MRTQDQLGFTLLEVLLSVAILAMLGALSMPVYQSFLVRNDLSNNTQAIASTMRRAEQYATGSKNDSSWGVKVQASLVTLFKGTSFTSRDTSYDETVTLPSTITASGTLSEVYFNKMTAAPSTTGSFTLTSSTNDTRTISLNAEGLVTY